MILKESCSDEKCCCEGNMYLRNVLNILKKHHAEVPIGDGDLTCEILTIKGLVENCPYCEYKIIK